MEDLQQYANEFSYARDPAAAIAAGEQAAANGSYTREGLLDVVSWKTARTKPRIVSTNAEIDAATAAALAADDEVVRMEALTALPGVGVPVASVLLLYACGESYPILDYKALASLDHRRRGVYPTAFWLRYLTFVRDLAQNHNMTARQVEKALWEFAQQHSAQCGL